MRLHFSKLAEMRLTLFVLMLLATFTVSGQRIIFPEGDQWRLPAEGTETKFSVRTDTIPPHFTLEGNLNFGMLLDSVGNFTWKPSFDLVDRLEKQKEITVMFQAEWKGGKKSRKAVTFIVSHTNRPPVVEELPVFYVKQGTANKYQISPDYVMDPDGDPLVYKSVLTAMPEGATFSSLGLIGWSPSRNQFMALKSLPIFIEFIVQDPDKAESKGKVKVAQTQLDLPPELLLVPGDTIFNIKEDDRVNIKLYVTDPNGDENISSVSFLASDERVLKTSLKENSPVQSEFVWSPGYEFVDEVEKTKEVRVVFFAIDKAANRVQKRVIVRVTDAENITEKDKMTYSKYRATLVQMKSLIEQLDANHTRLSKQYKQAKRGKKQRSLVNAALGATTGLSPVIFKPDESKVVSAVGGTTVLTLGTLEATEVIGKSKNDILDRQKLNSDIRNQLQVEGDNFARKYALKSMRRGKDFETDREKLLPVINNPKLPQLELDASKPSMPNYTSKEMRTTFPDFSDE